jgi:hypothetical protein
MAGKVTKLSDRRSVEAQREEWLRNYPDKFLACRGRAHRWPDIVPGKKITRAKFEPYHDPTGEREGCYYQEERCSNCGRIRWRITGPPGAFYLDATKWKYQDPNGYKSPAGLELMGADYKELFYERLLGGDQYTADAVEEHGA